MSIFNNLETDKVIEDFVKSYESAVQGIKKFVDDSIRKNLDSNLHDSNGSFTFEVMDDNNILILRTFNDALNTFRRIHHLDRDGNYQNEIYFAASHRIFQRLNIAMGASRDVNRLASPLQSSFSLCGVPVMEDYSLPPFRVVIYIRRREDTPNHFNRRVIEEPNGNLHLETDDELRRRLESEMGVRRDERLSGLTEERARRWVRRTSARFRF